MNVNYFGCDRFTGGYYSDDPTQQESFQYCNTTRLYGENATQADIDSTRLVNHFVATLYFITFILISAFVMLSLFIGAITMSMTQSMEQMKAAEEEVERKERLEKAQEQDETNVANRANTLHECRHDHLQLGEGTHEFEYTQ